MAVRLEPTPERVASETVIDDRELRLTLIEIELADTLAMVRRNAALLRVLLDKLKD